MLNNFENIFKKKEKLYIFILYILVCTFTNTDLLTLYIYTYIHEYNLILEINFHKLISSIKIKQQVKKYRMIHLASNYNYIERMNVNICYCK